MIVADGETAGMMSTYPALVSCFADLIPDPSRDARLFGSACHGEVAMF